MVKRMKILSDSFERIIYNKNESYRLRTLLTILFVGGVSLLMSVVNIAFGEVIVLVITGVSAALNGLFAYILIKTEEYKSVRIFFSLLCMMMIALFIFFGSSDGIAAYWAFLLPFMSVFLYGFKKGTYLSLGMFGMIVLFLWTPFTRVIEYDYSATFHLRFPLLFLAFVVAAAITDYIREITLDKLESTVKELNLLTSTDALTQVENRRSIEKRLHEMWELFEAQNNHISVLMIDIDYFKQYNDYYGHLEGDEALKKVAGIMATVVTSRKGYVARWGGEEFICLLPFSDCQQSHEVAQRILGKVNKTAIDHKGSRLKNKILTVSIGIASVNVTKGIEPELMIKGADESLYEAKDTGRNKIGPCKTFG